MALVVKDLPTNAGVIRDMGSIPETRRSPGEERGNPLQYSYLENTMDRGVWWTAVHRVTKSWTQLKRLSSESISYWVNWWIWLPGSWLFAWIITYIVLSVQDIGKPFLSSYYDLQQLGKLPLPWAELKCYSFLSIWSLQKLDNCVLSNLFQMNGKDYCGPVQESCYLGKL